MCRWVLLAVMATLCAGAEPLPTTFVELAPRQGYELQARPAGMPPDGPWQLPVLVDTASGEVIYDWTWRSRGQNLMGGLPPVTTTPLGHGILHWYGATILCQGMSADGATWVAFSSNDKMIGVIRHRSPFTPREFAVLDELPYLDPACAEAFRRQLTALAETYPNVAGGEAPALVGAEVVAGLNRIDIGPGEPDFPTPKAKRIEASQKLWKLAAQILDAAFERWQEPAYVTSYGCIYSPDGVVPSPDRFRSAVWRDVVLPPQVRQRIAALKDMREGPDRARLRRETNRLLLDYLVPSAGVASLLIPVAVPEKYLGEVMYSPLLPPSGFEIRVGKSQTNQPFDGISVWYTNPSRPGSTPHCVCAITSQFTVSYKLEQAAE